MTHPKTLTACGVDLERREPGHNDAYYSAAIGPVHVALRTKDGHWWSRVKPPAWILIPEHLAGPLPQADAIKAIEREAAKCIAAIRQAEANWLVAGEWLNAERSRR